MHERSRSKTSEEINLQPSFEHHQVQQEIDTESNISITSFKRWHRYLQNDHMLSRHHSFSKWKHCYKCCAPCRWFDSIAYDKKICKCCLTFKTFKTWGTIILLAIFFYIFMYSVFKKEVFPGGTIFFIFVLSLTAYVVGYSLILIGLPPMLGHLGIGILFGNLPISSFLAKDDHMMDKAAETAEKILVVIALIRAGLYLDISRIRYHYVVILLLGFVPFFGEIITIWIASHYLLHLPWDWSAIQGALMSVASLASIFTVMTKNKLHGYGEDKDLAAVLIAGAVFNVVFGLYFYTLSVSLIFITDKNSVLMTFLYMIRDLTIGLMVGIISGLLISFFPDKRNTEAAALRIIMIGCASFSLANVFYELRMITEAVISCLTLSIIAANMWEELGWHKENNPVQYFYSLAYYFSQPVVLSLLGFTMNFTGTNPERIGLAIAVLFIGLFVREVLCFLVLLVKTYPTNCKEKAFICIAWASKGTFQALLAFSIKYVVLDQHKNNPIPKLDEFKKYIHYLKETTVISILMTTPLVCFMLAGLTPILLEKYQHETFAEPRPRARRLTSIKSIAFPN